MAVNDRFLTYFRFYFFLWVPNRWTSTPSPPRVKYAFCRMNTTKHGGTICGETERQTEEISTILNWRNLREAFRTQNFQDDIFLPPKVHLSYFFSRTCSRCKLLLRVFLFLHTFFRVSLIKQSSSIRFFFQYQFFSNTIPLFFALCMCIVCCCYVSVVCCGWSQKINQGPLTRRLSFIQKMSLLDSKNEEA